MIFAIEKFMGSSVPLPLDAFTLGTGMSGMTSGMT